MLTKQKFWINDMEAITCIMFILIVIGTINICSASLITAYTNFENPYFFLIRLKSQLCAAAPPGRIWE